MRIVLDHNAPSKLFEKHDDIEEILEEVHDIKEEEDLPDNEPVEKEEIVEEIIPLGTLKFEKPIEFPKKNVKYIKARPISANLKEKSPNSNYVGSQPILEKKIEEKTININTNPFKSLSRPKTEISTRKTHDFIQNQKEFKESPIKTKNTRENKNNMESPLKTKGLEHLLKKIELLNEDKKQELELFLEKIVDGKLDIKSLLNFEFSSQEKHISLPSKFSNRVESSFLTKKQTEQHKRIESNINLIQNNLEMQNNYPEESFRNQKNHNVEISQNNENILRDKSLKTENIPLDKNILKLRILSTWGSIYIAGITEIHLYSVSGDRIHVSVNDLLIKNASFPNSKNLKNLINDIYETIDENNMWSGYMPAPPDCLELSMIFQRNLEIGLIYIWNYNKSLIESIKGIKEIEILLNNQLVWSGIVKRGVGNEYEDYRETIQIRRECNVSKVLNEEKEKKNEGLFEDLMPATRKTVSRAHPKTYKLFEEIENQELVRRNTGSVATEGDKTFEKIGEKCTEDEFGKNSFLGKPKGKSEKYIVDKQKLDRNLDIFEEKSKKNNIDKVDLKEKHKKSEKNDDNSKKEVFLLEKVKPLEELLVKQMEILKEGIIDKTNDSLSVDKSLQKPSGKLVQIPKEILKEKQIEKANNLDKFYSDKPLQKLAPIIEKTTIDKQIIGKSIFEKPLLDKHSDKSNLDKPIIEKSIDKIFIEKTCIKEKIFDKLIEKPTQKENEKPIEIIEKPAQKVISENLISEKPKTTDKPNEKSRMDNIFKRYTEENDQNSLDKLLYFNLTNEGRLRPGSRERFLQAEALTMQKDVQNSLKILQTNIDLNEESDDLGVFFKKEQNPFNKNERISQINPFKSKDKMENFFEYVGSECPEEIVIPLLPKGRHLSFNLLSTWGDEHYIGLAGIELFNDKGIPITLQSFQIKANPPDINILPGYGQDPRTIDKLLDGIYTTSDDLHMWLAPFTKGNNHIIQIDLGTPYRISMIRMWNYNKSRIHSFRGARNLKIQFDERKIFEGEIKKASGILENCKDRCEYIMFTSDETVISCIEKNDWLNQQQLILKNNQEKFRAKEIFQERPDTGNKDLEEIEGLLNERVGIDGRPMTSVLRTAFIDEKPKIETRNEITKETFEV